MIGTIFKSLGAHAEKSEIHYGYSYLKNSRLITLPLNLALVRIAFRNLPRRKSRNVLTILAVVIGVSLFTGSSIGFDNILEQYQDITTQAVGNVDIAVRDSLELGFNSTIISTIQEQEYIDQVSARLSSRGKVWNGSVWQTTTVIGVNMSTDFDYLDDTQYEIEGTRKLLSNSTDAVFDAAFNIDIGEVTSVNITIFTNNTFQTWSANFTCVGLYHPSEGFGNESANTTFTRTIFIELARAQFFRDFGNNVTNIIIALSDPQKTTEVVEQLEAILGIDYIVVPVKLSLLNTINDAISGLRAGLSMMSWISLWVTGLIILAVVHMNIKERVQEIGTLRAQGASSIQVLWMFLAESLFIGIIGSICGLLLGLFLSPSFSLAGRVLPGGLWVPDLTFDVSRITVNHIVLGCGSGVVTAIIGSLWPSLAATRTTIVQTIRPEMRTPGKLRVSAILLIIGLPLTLLVPFLPPIYDYTERFNFGLPIMFAFAPLLILGICCLVAGVLRILNPVLEPLLRGWGATRKIIARNVERDLWRSGLCFAMIGLSFSLPILMNASQSITLNGVTDMIQSFSVSDLIVTMSDTVDRSFADNLTNIDSGALIQNSAPALVLPQKSLLLFNETEQERTAATTLLVIDPVIYSQVMTEPLLSDETPANAFTLLNEENVILTEPIANTLDVDVGSIIQLRYVNYTEIVIPVITPNGTSFLTKIVPVPAWVNLTVIGIVQGAFMETVSVGSFSLADTCYVAYDILNDTFPQYIDNATMFFVKSKANQDLHFIEERVLSEYEHAYEMVITTYKDIVDQLDDNIASLFATFETLTLFAISNSGLGVGVIMIMNIYERRRELGILRTQGTSRVQVIASVLGEALILGVLGLIVAIFLGLAFQLITLSFMTSEGFPPQSFVLPIAIIQNVILYALGITIIGAFYPAWKAGRIRIVEALRYT